jgi:hypothetical protein
MGPDNISDERGDAVPSLRDCVHDVQSVPSDTELAHAVQMRRLALRRDLPQEMADVSLERASDIHREHLRQARLAFNWALFLGTCGFLMLIAALAGFLFFGLEFRRAVFTAAVGLVMKIFSQVNTLQEKSNRRLEQTLREEHRFLRAMLQRINR